MKLNPLAKTIGSSRIKFKEPLKYHTKDQDAGNAEAFYIATNQKEMQKILDLCYELKIPFLFWAMVPEW